MLPLYGTSITYEGKSDAALPVTTRVTYYLDGQEIAPGSLAARSGRVRIRFDYTNHTRETVTVDGQNYTVCVILSDLSKRVTAREMAERFGISESSFKFYVKGILGESYLAYFRRKRMEKAAAMLESTNMKVIEIANAVGYENQGKFARVFAETYGVALLKFRRLSK